jgi:hypothetical protein
LCIVNFSSFKNRIETNVKIFFWDSEQAAGIIL